MRGRKVVASLGLALAFLVPARSAAAKEVPPPGTPPWEEIEGAPDWAESPPAREGYVRVVDSGMSNLRQLAHSGIVDGKVNDVVLHEFREEVARRLRGVLGDAAEGVAEKVKDVAFVRRASSEETWDPGALGGSACTVWGLWEAPIATLLDAVPEAKRDAAAKALAILEGAGVPWESGDAEPAWLATPTQRKGFALVLVHEWSKSPEKARATVMGRGNDALRWEVQSALEPLLGREKAFPVGQAAASLRTLRARCVVRERRRSIAWVGWDVPLEPLLAKVPEESREKARPLLDRVLREQLYPLK